MAVIIVEGLVVFVEISPIESCHKVASGSAKLEKVLFFQH
jgi:hypothetical protein